MRYIVDIDGTICQNTYGKYTRAKPYAMKIKKINKLYDEGHTIIYFTARGTGTGLPWYNYTKEQLKKWKCKFHKLILGKPEGDFFIDDKNLTIKEFFNE